MSASARNIIHENRADYVYMAPPFIAYYGALQGGTNGSNLLQEAYDQCRLYRAALFDPDASLWRHITLGDEASQDSHHWGTGAFHDECQTWSSRAE